MSYLFDVNQNTHLDSLFMGNKTRFANHGSFGLDNATVVYRFIQGRISIGFFAKENIKIGDEILFDYGAEYQMQWLLEFNQKQQSISRERKPYTKKKKQIDLFEPNENNENKLSEVEKAIENLSISDFIEM